MWWWLALLGCDEEPVEPERFNASGQDLTVLVQPECTADELLPPSLSLRSNVGGIEIGTAQVVPGCGPVGTDHELQVEVFDEWEALIDEARVVALPESVSDLDGDNENEARDSSTVELERDGADAGVFAVFLRSLGAPDEVRADRWRVELLTYPDETTP